MKRGAKIAEGLLVALAALLVVASLCFFSIAGDYGAAYAMLAVGLAVTVIASLIDL
jgi:hypothetical protein